MLNKILLKSKLGDSPEARTLKAQMGELTERELFHIDVYGLADTAGISRAIYLDLFLKGVASGIFTLQWEYHCPQCGGIARENLTLRESRSTDHCTLCQLDFTNTLNRNVEVFFNPTGDLAILPDKFRKEYFETVGEHLQSGKRYEWIGSHTIFGSDCVQNKVFRDLIKDELLPSTSSLQIEQATILFTDIKGSTHLYEKLGDTTAYRLVRDHFSILFEAISQFRGVPIKTIGDAVMGVFLKREDALLSAFQMLDQLHDFNQKRIGEDPLLLKIGLHTGTTIVVTLNDRLDYFGSTVNRAARAQSNADTGEIIITQEVFDHRPVRKILSKRVRSIRKGKVFFKGLDQPQTIYRIRPDQDSK